MTVEEMDALFDAVFDEEFLRFDRVEGKRSNRPDLHGFLLLDELVPGDRSMISAADHDEYWLGVSLEALAAAVTPAQIIELIRCGIRCDTGCDSMAVFA